MVGSGDAIPFLVIWNHPTVCECGSTSWLPMIKPWPKGSTIVGTGCSKTLNHIQPSYSLLVWLHFLVANKHYWFKVYIPSCTSALHSFWSPATLSNVCGGGWTSWLAMSKLWLKGSTMVETGCSKTLDHLKSSYSLLVWLHFLVANEKYLLKMYNPCWTWILHFFLVIESNSFYDQKVQSRLQLVTTNLSVPCNLPIASECGWTSWLEMTKPWPKNATTVGTGYSKLFSHLQPSYY